MAITRRGLCSAAALAFVGAGGCLGDDEPEDGSDGDAENGADTENGADAGTGNGTVGTENDADADSEDGTDDSGDDADDSGGDADPGGDSEDDSAAADVPDDIAEWEWSGRLPVDSVVQHYDPTCGCCSRYIAYLEMHDIDVERAETSDLGAVKDEFDVPADARSCHTVEFGDYLVEGHVPLEAIETLLEEEPDVDGISAPGMPAYSPGMGPRGEEPLVIYAFEKDGEVAEYVEV